jgi:cytidylate kinase
MEEKYIISIGRQLGSGGREIAAKLAERLNINVYDKKLLQVAAKETGIDAAVFENADEQEANPFMRGLIALKGVMGSYGMGVGSCMDEDSLFEMQSDVMRRLAEKESCIIIGRCAEYVLRDHPRIHSFFITADMPDRVARIMEHDGVSEAKAKEIAEKGDKKRRCHVLYNCLANRPGIKGENKENEKDPDTESLPISAVPLPNGDVKASTTAETTAEVVAGWYKSVWQRAAAED